MEKIIHTKAKSKDSFDKMPLVEKNNHLSFVEFGANLQKQIEAIKINPNSVSLESLNKKEDTPRSY